MNYIYIIYRRSYGLSKEGYQKYLEELENIKKKIEKNNIDITEYISDDTYGDGWHDNFA